MTQAITHVSADDYEKVIKEKNSWNFDVREKYEFEAGHIKGAKLVPSTRFDENFNKLKIKKTDKICLYCRTGSRSAYIAEKLKEQGFKKIFNLELGTIDWLEQGKKLV